MKSVYSIQCGQVCDVMSGHKMPRARIDIVRHLPPVSLTDPAVRPHTDPGPSMPAITTDQSESSEPQYLKGNTILAEFKRLTIEKHR